MKSWFKNLFWINYSIYNRGNKAFYWFAIDTGAEYITLYFIRYKQWKCFFGVQDPRKELPSTKTHPNFKIGPFLYHMQKVSMEARDMEEIASFDEQDVGFTGCHQDKQIIN